MQNQRETPWTNARRELGRWRGSGSQISKVWSRPLCVELDRRKDLKEEERQRELRWTKRWACVDKREGRWNWERSGGIVRHLRTESGASARLPGRIGCLGRGWFLRRILASLVIARNDVKLTAYAEHPPTARRESLGFPLWWLPDGELNIPSTLGAFFACEKLFSHRLLH